MMPTRPLCSEGRGHHNRSSFGSAPLTILKVYSSPTSDYDRRSEFTEFYETAYSTIVGELLALTGGLDHARTVGAGSFSRAWQAWPSIRLLAEPEMWVRKDAMSRAFAPPGGCGYCGEAWRPSNPSTSTPRTTCWSP